MQKQSQEQNKIQTQEKNANVLNKLSTSYYHHVRAELPESEIKDYLNKILVKFFNEAVEKGEMKLGSSLSTDDIRNYYSQKDYFSTTSQIFVFVAKQKKLFIEKEYVEYVYKKLKETFTLREVYNKIDLQNYHYFLKPFFFNIDFEREEDVLNDLYDEFILNYGSKKKFANQINKNHVEEIEGKKIEIKNEEDFEKSYASEKRKLILSIVINKLKKTHKTMSEIDNEKYTYHQYVKNFVSIVENLKTKLKNDNK